MRRQEKGETNPRVTSLLLTTALSQMTDIRSSVPLVPSGIRVKLSFPTAFWAVLNVQWPLPVTWRSPLEGKHITGFSLQIIKFEHVFLMCQATDSFWNNLSSPPEIRNLGRCDMILKLHYNAVPLNLCCEVSYGWQCTTMETFWYLIIPFRWPSRWPKVLFRIPPQKSIQVIISCSYLLTCVWRIRVCLQACFRPPCYNPQVICVWGKTENAKCE